MPTSIPGIRDAALTPKERIATLRASIEESERQIHHIQSTCVHEFQPRDGDTDDAGECYKCGLYGGWYCSVAPDHVCHYPYDETSRGNNRFYILGEIIEAPNGSGGYRDDEQCVFCGSPEERK